MVPSPASTSGDLLLPLPPFNHPSPKALTSSPASKRACAKVRPQQIDGLGHDEIATI
jgi:hypothetical protein